MDWKQEEHWRSELTRIAHILHRRGWVANHDGNLSARLGEDRILCTPTACSKAAVTPESLLEVNLQGEKIAGTRRPFSELKLHLPAYRLRSDVRAVLHAHPPSATAFAVSYEPLPDTFIAEAVVSIGPRIPLIAFGMPGDPQLEESLTEALAQTDCFLLAGHGVLTVGPDPDLCLLRMELVEHLAGIALKARALGGPRPLPAELVETLTAKHQKLFPRELAGESAARPAAGSSWSPPETQRSARELVEEALRRLS